MRNNLMWHRKRKSGELLPIIPLLVTLVLISGSGCLVPGSPHHFGYRSTLDPNDSVDLVSMAHNIEYRVLLKGTVADSVFVLSPIDNKFKKMQTEKYFGNFYYESRQKVRGIKKIEKADTIVLRLFKKMARRIKCT